MNKKFGFLTLALLMMLSVGIVCAVPVSASIAPVDTIVGGTIYQGTTYTGSNGIAGANVEVICHHVTNSGTIDYTKTTTSITGGAYSVDFDNSPGNLCTYGDSVTVNAEWNGIEGSKDGKINMQYPLPSTTLNVGIVNVPLVPEFGIVAGAATVFSALVVFFIVRKK